MSGLAAFPARHSPVRPSFLGLLCGLMLALAAPAVAAAATPGPADLVDWTSADGVANVATGSSHGVSVTLTGSDVQVGGVTDGTFGGFAAAFFTPAVPATDAIALASFPGYSYTLTFSPAVTDPVLDLASLGSTLAFEAGTSLVRLSGQPGFVVSGATVIGAVGDLGSPNNDVNGSVQVIGTFTSLSFTATPVPAAPNGDGLYLQVALPFPPVNVVAPSVHAVAGGGAGCDPGVWRNLPTPTAFTYRWVAFRSAASVGAVVGIGQDFTPPPALFGQPLACQAIVPSPDGPVVATSARVFFSSAGLNALLAAYGDVRIRGIDAFQVVQPNEGARMYGYRPDAPYIGLCGGGTPTSWQKGLRGCNLGTRDAQDVAYRGVTLDRDKPTWAVVYVDVANAAAGDPALSFNLELEALAASGARIGAPVVVKVRNPPRSTTPWVQPWERDATQPTAGDTNRNGIAVRVPAAWQASSSLTLHAQLRFPDGSLATAAFGARECDAGPCTANDAFTLRGVPFTTLPAVVLSSLELRTSGQPFLPAPAGVLARARALMPGGEHIVVSPYSADIDISSVLSLTATAVPVAPGLPAQFTCNGVTSAAVTTRTCRFNAVSAIIQNWILANPARVPGGRGSSRRYDGVFAVHSYPTGGGGLEPGWTIGNITADSSTAPATANATPFLTANSSSRPYTAAAHELGHFLTAPHTAVTGACPTAAGPEPWAPDGSGLLQSTKFTPPFSGLGSAPGSGGATFAGSYPLPLGGTRNQVIYDLMSYCASLTDTAANPADAWLSARNWDRFVRELTDLGTRLTARTLPRSTRAATSGPVVVGVVGPAGGSLLHLTSAADTSGLRVPLTASPYTVRSLGSAGQVLLVTGVPAPTVASEAGDGSGPFSVPVAGGAVAVELLRDGTVISRLQRSRPPTITLTSPRAGVRARGTLAIGWRAADPDHDPLTATVDYSFDGGGTWQTVHDGPDRGRVALPTTKLAGSQQGRIRVRVSDGFSATSATSGVFSVPGHAPRVAITGPGATDEIRAGDRITLAGTALDDRGVFLTGRSLTWFRGTHRLGTGARLQARIPAGRQRIRLVATDSRGRRHTASVMIRAKVPALRLTLLSVPQHVALGARTVAVRFAASAPATVVIGGRQIAVGRAARRITLQLPRTPAVGVVRVAFRLVSSRAPGTVRGTISVARG